MVQHSFLIVMTFTTLVGVGSVSSSFLRPNKNACSCKNWKSVYQHGDVKCGAAEEFSLETNASNVPPVYRVYNDSKKELVCKHFWAMLDSDRCVNVNVGKDEGTWCYVNSACKILQGGSRITYQMSWRKCSKDDLKLRDYTPEELYSFAQEQDIGIGRLQKMSYPGSKVGERQLIHLNDIKNEIPAWVDLELKEFGDNSTPYWFDTNENATMPFVIVHGRKVYKVEQGPERDLKHPRTWSILNCTIGC